MKNLTKNLFQLFADFTKDASLQVENGNKAAGTRARKTSLAIEKALKEFRHLWKIAGKNGKTDPTSLKAISKREQLQSFYRSSPMSFPCRG